MGVYLTFFPLMDELLEGEKKRGEGREGDQFKSKASGTCPQPKVFWLILRQNSFTFRSMIIIISHWFFKREKRRHYSVANPQSFLNQYKLRVNMIK